MGHRSDRTGGLCLVTYHWLLKFKHALMRLTTGFVPRLLLNDMRLLNKASHLTAFYALYSSLHLPVTPAQLMTPGIGRNASCAVGDFA